jgi:hypothetical protein
MEDPKASSLSEAVRKRANEPNTTGTIAVTVANIRPAHVPSDHVRNGIQLEPDYCCHAQPATPTIKTRITRRTAIRPPIQLLTRARF